MISSAPLVLLAFGPGEYIALEPAELAAARDRAREILGQGPDNAAAATTQSSERLLTASEISSATGIPGPWFLEQARQGLIPHIKLGKYSRFRLSEVVQHGAVTSRPKDKRASP